MGKRRSLALRKVSNLIKISIFIAKMRLSHLKKSTKLKAYNHYGFVQERQFSPSSTPLISFRRRKSNGGSYYPTCFLSCFNGGVVLDEFNNYSMGSSAIVEVDKDGLELLFDFDQEEEEEGVSVDERAERFIESFYQQMKRQKY
ncbi:hypothetical protein QVD17_30933 [Tagetes erecta]|uniref:Uncharacterized protein n=1 Tax=Tagetes erecta TaxID=13708 RepID=A0AAD8K584_TARER|nr:hypothetical protein QVD17_30933 [Tagetes erecta]